MNSKQVDAFLKALRLETLGAPTSPISLFLAKMAEDQPKEAELLRQDIQQIFGTEQGARVLILLKNAVLMASLPAEASDRALREHNAQKTLINDLRRIVANA